MIGLQVDLSDQEGDGGGGFFGPRLPIQICLTSLRSFFLDIILRCDTNLLCLPAVTLSYVERSVESLYSARRCRFSKPTAGQQRIIPRAAYPGTITKHIRSPTVPTLCVNTSMSMIRMQCVVQMNCLLNWLSHSEGPC